MRIAAHFRWSLDELGERMSAEELGLWLTWFDMEPCDPASLVALWSQHMAALCNGLLTRKDKRAFVPDDFLPADRWAVKDDALPPKQMTRKETAAALKAMFARPKGKG